MYNKVNLIGRLGQDPELKYTNSGSAVANFSVATTKSWIDKATSEKKESTQWHRIIVWGKRAELCNQYLRKGARVFVEGEVEYRSWDDKDGNKRYTTEINASNVQFFDMATDDKTANNSNDNNQPQSDYNISTDTNFASDDIPF